MVPGAPIVTISFGEERKFRLSRGRGEAKEVRDFPAPHGTAFVLPQETNAVWKHAVPKSTRYTGRRVSVTIRGFANARDSGFGEMAMGEVAAARLIKGRRCSPRRMAGRRKRESAELLARIGPGFRRL
jgi:hypothetical protein